MSPISLDIREDRNHPEGGHAVIRIKGLKSKPDNGSFIIEPAAITRDGPALKGWPRGARRPLKTTMSSAGFEIVVGPDVVESPVLLPGTPVIVKVPAAGVSAEALWPDITPLRRQKVKRIITSSERRDALARAQSNVTTLEPANSVRGAQNNLVQAGGRNGSNGNDPGTAGAAARSVGNLARLEPAPVSSKVQPDHNTTALPSLPRVKEPTPDDNAGHAVRSRGTAPKPVADLAGAKAPPAAAKEKSVADPAPSKTGKQKLAAAPSAPQSMQAHQSEQVPQVRELRVEKDRGSRFGTLLSGMIAGLLMAIVLGYGYVSLNGWPDLAAVGLAPPHPVVAQIKTDNGLAIYEALKVDAISPRGIDATTVDGETAIVRADASLHAGGDGAQRDTQEGAFWLKTYLAKQIGGKQTLWALTQLGSTYARPMDGPPDYKKAQALWEASAALGDPYAACFLGQLHEFGLGVTASRDLALTWYLRARAAGGCKSLDQAIARLGG